MEEGKELAVQELPEVFGRTIEQARQSIDNSLELYSFTREVINKLLKEDDFYYMGELNGGKKKPNEKPVYKKQAVDKLANFFKIKMFPHTEKTDGGYEVSVIAKDINDNYIGTASGICTTYEKKYKWIKADDEEYNSANKEERRIFKKQYGSKTYENKQIKTDERALAHTLISMATKRARGAVIKMALCLDDISFEGEEPQPDYGSSKTNSMSKDEISEWYERLKEKYTKKKLDAATMKITKTVKVGNINIDTAQAIEDELISNAKAGTSDQQTND